MQAGGGSEAAYGDDGVMTHDEPARSQICPCAAAAAPHARPRRAVAKVAMTSHWHDALVVHPLCEPVGRACTKSHWAKQQRGICNLMAEPSIVLSVVVQGPWTPSSFRQQQ